MHSLHARIRILTLKKLIVCPDRKQYLKKAINNVKKKERGILILNTSLLHIS